MRKVRNIFALILFNTLLNLAKGECPTNSKAVLRNHQKLCIELYKVEYLTKAIFLYNFFRSVSVGSKQSVSAFPKVKTY